MNMNKFIQFLLQNSQVLDKQEALYEYIYFQIYTSIPKYVFHICIQLAPGQYGF